MEHCRQRPILIVLEILRDSDDFPDRFPATVSEFLFKYPVVEGINYIATSGRNESRIPKENLKGYKDYCDKSTKMKL